VDCRPQIEKAAVKLSSWYWKNLTQAGRASLTKLVLSSQPVYFLTVVKPTKDFFEPIDKIRRRFHWAVIRLFQVVNARSIGQK
jgi:hypothetical protein